MSRGGFRGGAGGELGEEGGADGVVGAEAEADDEPEQEQGERVVGPVLGGGREGDDDEVVEVELLPADVVGEAPEQDAAEEQTDQSG